MKKGVILGTLGVAIVGLVGCIIKTIMSCSQQSTKEDGGSSAQRRNWLKVNDL